MRKILTVPILTLVTLALMDLAVAGLLTWADAQGRLGSLVRYFDYGRSVPGKLEQWEADPDRPGNLYDLAWRPEMLAESAASFATEPDTGPVVRSYGMSFVNHIIDAARELDPDLVVDRHAGPGVPPNFTYALFQDDRANRRAGDVVVLGVLSSALPAMAALSNSTWVFEQPAPFTYPIYRPEGAGLTRIDPVVATLTDQQQLGQNPALAAEWAAQLSGEDAFYGPVTFGAVWLDASPFVRLVRRARAQAYVNDTKTQLRDGGFPISEVLDRMISTFAQTARADGQIPVVMLIQTGRVNDLDLLDLARPALTRADVPYLATTEHQSPRDPTAFLPDGHYRPDIDVRFGAAFIQLMTDPETR